MIFGTDGLYPSELCGRIVLYSLLHFSVSSCTSANEWKISLLSSSSRNFLLKLS